MGRSRIVFKGVDGQIKSAIDLAINQMSDFTPVFRRIVKHWPETRKEVFAALQGPTAAELGYARMKRAMTGHVLPLRFKRNPGSERLFKSLTNVAHKDAIMRLTQKTLELGTRVPYAVKHLTGGIAPARLGGHMFPKRDWLAMGRLTLVVADAVGDFAGEIGKTASGVRSGFDTSSIRSLPIPGVTI